MLEYFLGSQLCISVQGWVLDPLLYVPMARTMVVSHWVVLAAILISIFFTSCPHRVFKPSLLVGTFLIKRHHYPLLFAYLLFVFVFTTASVKTHSWNSCDYIKGLMFTWFIMNLIVYMVITPWPQTHHWLHMYQNTTYLCIWLLLMWFWFIKSLM